MNQVTRWSSTSQYVTLDLYFETYGNPVSIKLEAYVIKDMNAPRILGNDFTDQYSLSILRENDTTTLRLGYSGYSIPLNSSINSSFLKVQALQPKASKFQCQQNNHDRCRLKGPNRVYVSEPSIICPCTIGRIPMCVTCPLAAHRIFVPLLKLMRGLRNSMMINSILPSNPTFLLITNDVDTPIHFKASDILGTIESDNYFNSHPPTNTSHAQSFFNLVTPILQSKENEDQPSADIKYSIKVKDSTEAISMLPYPASPEKWADINKRIDKWFSQGVIQELESAWGAPVIIVCGNSKAHVCIDYWKVNAITLADKYPLPRQSDILHTLSSSQWLFTFDALSGLHQLKVVKEDWHITTLHTHKHSLLEFTWLPFRLHKGPAVFQGVMNKVLAKFLWLFMLVYIDDINISSQTFNHHVQWLNSILGAITRVNVTSPLPKCHISYKSLILLGQRVSHLGISTPQEKIDTVNAMKPPTKVKELQMFLGFVNYLTSYIPFYTWITQPLYRLLAKDTLRARDSIHQELTTSVSSLSSLPPFSVTLKTGKDTGSIPMQAVSELALCYNRYRLLIFEIWKELNLMPGFKSFINPANLHPNWL